MKYKPNNTRTLGDIAQEEAQKAPASRFVLEIAQESTKDHFEQIIWCIKHAQKKVDCSKMRCTAACDKHIVPIDDCYSLVCADYCKTRESHLGNVYVECINKTEPLLANVTRTYFTWRIDCPTPTYDQSVFKYDSSSGNLLYLWTVPDRESCIMLLKHAKEVHKDEQQILGMVIEFADGTLFRLMKKENGEKDDTPELKKKEMHVIRNEI